MKIGVTNARSRGFTLVELIIVIVIIGILAAIAVPQFTGVQNSAKRATVKASGAAAQSSAAAYYASNPLDPSDNCEVVLGPPPGQGLVDGDGVFVSNPLISVADASGVCTVSHADLTNVGDDIFVFTLPWVE